MSDPVLPASDILEYEPLEFTKFPHDVRSIGRPSSYVKNKKGKMEDVVLPTAAEIEAMQTQAREEGYQAGFSEGFEKGNAQMTALLTNMDQAIRQADQDIAQDVLDLALELARQMVQQTLKTKPEVLLNTIREAVASLPHISQGAHLYLHPEDIELVKQHIGEHLSHTGWKIFEDMQITPGGARIETNHSQVDATLENRWKRIVAAIGQDQPWMEE